MRSLLVLWTFPGTRFTCDDFNWGVDAIYDYCKGFRLKVECYFIVFRIPYKCCTTDGVLPDYGMPTVLDVAWLQLCFVSTKKDSCLPLYIVPASHRIDERESSTRLARRGFVLSCNVILLPIIVIRRRRAFRGFLPQGFSRKNPCLSCLVYSRYYLTGFLFELKCRADLMVNV